MSRDNRWKSCLGLVLILGAGIPVMGEPVPSPMALSESELQTVQDSAPVPIALQDANAGAPGGMPPGDLSTEMGAGLQEILDIALAQSPNLAVQRSKLNESKMRALATGLLPNPQVGGGAKKVSGGGTGPLLEISQEVPVNGVRQLERRSADLQYNADRNALMRETQVILIDVERAFLGVLAAMEEREVESQAVEISKNSKDIAADRFNSGVISSLPSSLAQAEYANALKSLNLAEKDVLLARQELARTLGLSEPELPQINGSIHESFLPPNLDPENFQRPDKTAASLRVQSAQTSVSAAQRARIPNPVLGYSREEAGSDTENFFKVGFELPILNNGNPLVRQRMAEAGTVRSEKEALDLSVDAEREQAREKLGSRKDAVRVYEEEIRPSINQSLEAANSAFQTGVSDLSLLLQTQQRLIEMERGYVDALRDLREAELDYLLALGVRNGQIDSY
ncbi:MAG: TolC family protein [Candidatus Omnitrophica bacterium]|nr:TolC family protein [Candidatus Omnitrophota bacterium]